MNQPKRNIMPNQLAKNKLRKSLAEHAAVLKALEEVARLENTSSMALMREAIRETIRKHISDSQQQSDRLRKIVMSYAPKPDQHFSSTSQLSRFKRSQREFDQILLDLQLSDSDTVEKHNSIISPTSKIRVLELEHKNE